MRDRHIWLLCALLLTVTICKGQKTSKFPRSAVVVLTDDNFDELVNTSTIWMVDIYAPWCAHCRQLEPTWRAFAEDAKVDGVSVGKVNGEQERVLVRRFGITAYPSIFLLRNGQAWHYEGPRSPAALKEFALRGYRDAEAVPFHKCPTSLGGRLMGKLYSVPSLIRKVYHKMRREHGWSDLAIVASVLAIPVIAGALGICALDAAYLRRTREGHDHDE